MSTHASRNLLMLGILAALISCCLGCVFINREQRKHLYFKYIGCYKDKPAGRDLPIPGGHGEHIESNECNLLCKKTRTKFMGLQDGGFCYCGNKFNKYGKVEDSVCDTPCQGNPKEKCGSRDHNSVFETKYE